MPCYDCNSNTKNTCINSIWRFGYFIIDELPPNRKHIETYPVTRNFERRVEEFIRKNVNEGRQAYVVCPLVEEMKNSKISSQW